MGEPAAWGHSVMEELPDYQSPTQPLVDCAEPRTRCKYAFWHGLGRWAEGFKVSVLSYYAIGTKKSRCTGKQL